MLTLPTLSWSPEERGVPQPASNTAKAINQDPLPIIRIPFMFRENRSTRQTPAGAQN